MNKKRPVNLDISTIHFPVTSIVSILHRASGIVLFAGVAVLLWMLGLSLESQKSFLALKDSLQSPVCQFLIWGTLAALAYHAVAGVRHLLMDMGVGETLEGGRKGAHFVLLTAIVLIVLTGVWIW